MEDYIDGVAKWSILRPEIASGVVARELRHQPTL